MVTSNLLNSSSGLITTLPFRLQLYIGNLKIYHMFTSRLFFMQKYTKKNVITATSEAQI